MSDQASQHVRGHGGDDKSRVIHEKVSFARTAQLSIRQTGHDGDEDAVTDGSIASDKGRIVVRAAESETKRKVRWRASRTVRGRRRRRRFASHKASPRSRRTRARITCPRNVAWMRCARRLAALTANARVLARTRSRWPRKVACSLIAAFPGTCFWTSCRVLHTVGRRRLSLLGVSVSVTHARGPRRTRTCGRERPTAASPPQRPCLSSWSWTDAAPRVCPSSCIHSFCPFSSSSPCPPHLLPFP